MDEDVTHEHEHAWSKIWELKQDGRVVGLGLKCRLCGTVEWTGRKPDRWDIFQ